MNAHIKHQIIEKDGAPLFVLVPYNEYIESLQKQQDVYFPHEVVELHAIEGKSLVRAWREYKGMSQKRIAAKINISQSAFSQMEKPDATLRRSTLEKIAAALEISVEQLMD
jgi:ribosome-binding protein aMBF1 (putative translation factor)